MEDANDSAEKGLWRARTRPTRYVQFLDAMPADAPSYYQSSDSLLRFRCTAPEKLAVFVLLLYSVDTE